LSTIQTQFFFQLYSKIQIMYLVLKSRICIVKLFKSLLKWNIIVQDMINCRCAFIVKFLFMILSATIEYSVVWPKILRLQWYTIAGNWLSTLNQQITLIVVAISDVKHSVLPALIHCRLRSTSTNDKVRPVINTIDIYTNQIIICFN
jgi:thiamine transporter ThiT